MSLAHDTSAVFDAALALPREKREELAKAIVISLDADHPKSADHDRLWAEEIKRRGEALDSGLDPGIDEEEAMRRIRHASQQGRKS
jgi:putative addiction module component (TIGR02574 family)